MADSRFMMNVKGISIAFVPRIFFQTRLKSIFKELLKNEDKILEQMSFRVNYYNKINEDFSEILSSSKDKEKIGKLPFKNTSYAYDAYKLSKYFKDELLWIKKYGDISYNLKEPSICKSRLIEGENQNNILLKLDKNRHFNFVNDELAFEDKKDKAVWRGAAYQKHRVEFLQNYFDKGFCDIGDTIKRGKYLEQYKKGSLSKKAQMKFKFIISLEGNDVASGLKWNMSSNSLVFSPKMRCETWFMEGKLKPNEHFVLIDNENLEEKIEYYKTHIKEAKEIVKNAHSYIEQFLDEEKEFYIGILVLAKYFYYSNQIKLPKEILSLIKG